MLLHCFDIVCIPLAVQEEIGDLILPLDIKLVKISPLSRHFVYGAVGHLHRGELKAMVLAQEIQADYVLLDDLAARRKAKRFGLKMIGTVGIIQLAYQANYISSTVASNYLDQLVQQHGLYLSTTIFDKLKKQWQPD